MKSCPTCNRTYADETFAFCLADGSLLSPSFDPEATLVIPTGNDLSEGPVTKFWDQYWDYARTYFPDVSMKRPRDKGANAMWIYFQPGGPGSKAIIHKLNKGYVDLQINGAGALVDVLNSKNAPLFWG